MGDSDDAPSYASARRSLFSLESALALPGLSTAALALSLRVSAVPHGMYTDRMSPPAVALTSLRLLPPHTPGLTLEWRTSRASHQLQPSAPAAPHGSPPTEDSGCPRIACA